MHAVLGDFIVDCVQNSVEAGAGRIEVDILQKDSRIRVSIRDNGCGMDERQLARAQDPFYTDGKKHVHRKVGLGLPFLRQAMDLAGGEFRLESEKNRGTELVFGFDSANVDSPPLGRLDEAFLQILMFSGDHELVINRGFESSGKEEKYGIVRSELLEVLGSLEEAESLIMARDFLRNQEESLNT